MIMKKLLQSPLNYTGGKYKLLPQILPHFPDGIDTFVDLFCGGTNVGCNVNCNKVIFNDYNRKLIDLLRTFQSLNKEDLFNSIFEIIDKYNLSNSAKHDYSYYNCNSYNGLGRYNKESFNRLKYDFNNGEYDGNNYYIALYVLIVFSFNNQIRFNNKEEFNLPVGKRDFNSRMQVKLSKFVDRIKSLSCTFINEDFRCLDLNLNENDFVYCDPPYLISCATYNENGMWNADDESDLLQFLDKLNHNNIRFALSNVLSSKGKTNDILMRWLEDNLQYRCIHLNYDYSNSNYQTKDRESGSDEVLIINY